MATDFDITIAGVQGRIARGQEGAFRERYVRTEITQNLLTQSEGSPWISRPDRPALYQKSWVGGTRWWRPLLAGDENDTYFTASRFDAWTQPGKIKPLNQELVAAGTSVVHPTCVAAYLADSYYVVANTSDDDPLFFDVALWTPASNDFLVEANNNSGVDASDDEPIAMVGDPSDGYIYVLSTGAEITRFAPNGTPASADAPFVTTETLNAGSNIFLHNQNLMFYSGDKLFTVTKAGPTVTLIANDGMGPDVMEDANWTVGATSTVRYRSHIPLAIASPEGIYYVKNTRQGGQIVAWLFRVDRDAAGNWNLNPLGTLPTGSVALGIGYHLGSVIITSTPDSAAAIRNASASLSRPVVEVFHLTGGSLGALGAPAGRDLGTDESPHRVLGSDGPRLYLGDRGKVWVYDGVTGGIHSRTVATGASGIGIFNNMAFLSDSDSNTNLVLIRDGEEVRIKEERVSDPLTVANLDNSDLDTYALQSNFFDANLPMEQKEITKVALVVEGGSADVQRFTVQLFSDQASSTTPVLTFDGGGEYAEQETSGIFGRLFTYRIAYQTKTAVKRAIKALLVTFSSGEMVREWEILLDGTEFINVDNKPISESEFAASMRTLAANESIVAASINYLDQDHNHPVATTVNVKIQRVEIIKDKPGESMIQLVLREA